MSRRQTVSTRARRARVCRSWRAPRYARQAWTALLVAVTYYASAQFGFALTFPSSPLSVIWPPNAFVFVVLLLAPLRMWWLVLVAVAPAHMLFAWQNGLPFETALGLYATNCAEAILAAGLVRRFGGGPPWLVSLRQVVVYVICAVIVAPLVTSFLDAGVNVSTGWGKDYWLLWQERLLSDALTFLTLPPALLIVTSLGRRWVRRIPLLRVLEAVLLALCMFAAGVVIFGPFSPGPVAQPTIVYEFLPLLLWAAVRFGVGGTSAALLGVTLLASIWSANHRMEPADMSTPAVDILTLQAQLLAMSIPVLWLAAVIQESTRAQQALRQSWQHYRAFFDLTAVGASEADPATGRLLRVNDAFCQITGYPREEMLGLSFRDLTHPADREEDWRLFRRVVEEGRAGRHAEKRYVRKDGQTIWVQVDTAIVRDEAGHPLHTAAIIQDISERKRAEEALRASEARFRAAFESAATGMMLVDTTGRSLQVNRPLTAMLGYSEEELRTQSFADFSYPDELSANLALLGQVLAGEIDSYQLEKRYIHKQGHLVWGHLSAGVVRDDAGRPLYLVAHLQDITDRKRAEEASRLSEARYRDLVETQTEMICRYLPDGTLTFVNDAYCRAFGRPREALIDTNFLDLLPESQAERARASLIQFVEHPGVVIDEHEVTLPDGSVGWQQWTDHAIWDVTGALVEIQAIGRDVTERKRAEEALRTSEARYRAVVETQTELIDRYLPDTTLTFVNDAYCRYYGKAREDVLGTRFIETLPAPAQAHVEAAIQSLLAHPGVVTIEHELELPDGSMRWHQWVNRTILDAEGRVAELQGIGRDITERKQAEEALEQLTARLLQVQDEERRRLARELHDGTAQTLAAIDLNLTTLRELARRDASDMDRFVRLLADSQALGEQAMREMRTMSYLLHPPRLDEAGLIPAVQWYVKGFSQRSGIRVDLVVPQDPGRLPAPVESALFRVIQECLTNVHRHSGSSTARIVLKRTQSAVHLVVADFGRGMTNVASAPAGESIEDFHELGVGIPGMRQRLRQLGGRLGIRSTRQGTVVMAMVPIDSEALDEAPTAVEGLRWRPQEVADAGI